MKDKAQGRVSDSSADTQEKEVEFSESLRRPEESEEDSSGLDRDNQDAIQEQPGTLRRSVRVTVPPTRYDWDDDHIFFALVAETEEPDSFREAIKADDQSKWITAME